MHELKANSNGVICSDLFLHIKIFQDAYIVMEKFLLLFIPEGVNSNKFFSYSI